MEPGHLAAANAAEPLRVALKRSFQRIRFSVRSATYAGDASIDVGWSGFT